MSTDNARAEAERHYPALNADDEALTYPRSAVREHARGGFVKGYEAGWAAALAAGRAETTTEWGVRYGDNAYCYAKQDVAEAHRAAREAPTFPGERPNAIVRREVTAWTEAE